MESFETKRVWAKRITATDLYWLITMHGNENVMRTLGGVRSAEETAENLRDYLKHWQDHGFGFWAMVLKESGARIGRIGLRHSRIDDTDEIELAYTLVDSHWGRGLATEVGTELLQHVRKRRLPPSDLVCFTSVDNFASRRVMDKLGFVYEKSFVYKDCEVVLSRQTFV